MIDALARLLAARSPRERWLLALAALVGVPLALIALVALPLVEERARAADDLAIARAGSDWFRDRQGAIAALPDSSAPAPAAIPAAIPASTGLGGIEAALIAAGLREAVALLANTPDGRVSLVLGAVPFEVLMPFVEALPHTTGHHLSALRLTRAGPGLVEAQLQLEAAR